jgi:CRISPR/Cas system CSM-associated protein Csm4 (group 5 of RAMP superfamily)
LPPPARSPRVMTLARYLPQDQEVAAGVLGPEASYELVQIGGWLHSPDAAAQRRRRVRMIETGSVLAQPAGIALVGRMVDVRPVYVQAGAPPHPVYRAGFALLVGVER